MTKKIFGWIPEKEMEKPQQAIHHNILDRMPKFHIRGDSVIKERRYPLWNAAIKLWGKPLSYIRQLTGSCVGAGGGNFAMTLLAMENLLGADPDEFHLMWWLYTYGESREIAGLKGKGEGSFGSAYAKAITKEGIFRADTEGLPGFKTRNGWIELTRETELEWSDGKAIASKWNEIGRQHLVKTMAPISGTTQAAEALANGYPLTIASMFGTKTIRTKGTPPVNIAEYDDKWPHQQSIDEYWDHPQLGPLYHVMNQWGPDAHPAPSSGEPAGGYYITESTFGKVLKERDTECYAGSQYNGYPAQTINLHELW